MMSVPYHPLQIANWFIEKSDIAGREITLLKLMKIVYIAHGFHLGGYKLPLFDEPVLAWQYGPVIRSIYDEFKHLGRSPITYRPNGHSEEPLKRDDDVEPMLEFVDRSYSHLTAGQLVTLTHEGHTPWEKTFKPSDRDRIIPIHLIEEHYREKIKDLERKVADE